jgi:hypothetical protein
VLILWGIYGRENGLRISSDSVEWDLGRVSSCVSWKDFDLLLFPVLVCLHRLDWFVDMDKKVEDEHPY